MASHLLKQQWKFTWRVAVLILYAYANGYRMSFGSARSRKECGTHRPGSYHFDSLAIDLNLFKLDGTYLEDTEDHRFLGEFWEKKLGGSWGGHWNDGNHYSYGESTRNYGNLEV